MHEPDGIHPVQNQTPCGPEAAGRAAYERKRRISSGRCFRRTCRRAARFGVLGPVGLGVQQRRWCARQRRRPPKQFRDRRRHPRVQLMSDHKRQGALGYRLPEGTVPTPDRGDDGRLARAGTIGPAPARQRIAITRQCRKRRRPGRKRKAPRLSGASHPPILQEERQPTPRPEAWLRAASPSGRPSTDEVCEHEDDRGEGDQTGTHYPIHPRTAASTKSATAR